MFGPDTPDLREKLDRATAGHIINRPGEAEEVAQAIAFAIENQFVTGTTIDVDGGWLGALGRTAQMGARPRVGRGST